MTKRKLPPIAVLGFLLPNLVGFLAFTLFPVLFSLWMAFTNWSLKPAVTLEYVGFRNFTDLLGVRPLQDADLSLSALYLGAVAAVVAGGVLFVWAAMTGWRGTRIGAALLGLLGLVAMYGAFATSGAGGEGGEAHFPQGLFLCGLVAGACGLALMFREELDWRLGPGALPPVLMAVGAALLWSLGSSMWTVYEPKDARFWQYFGNTVYLMLGIPFSIAGSLALALAVNNDLPLGNLRRRMVGAALCLACGMVTFGIVWSLGRRDLALLGGVFWLLAALGVAFNVVAYRTIYYLPTFTAGVALMILWKALYNTQTGPINTVLRSLFDSLHWQVEPPQWLASVAWAKPALMLMGIWTGIGGTTMLLYLAGLSNVPPELIDAAEVDGASAWGKFRHVTWPQLAPTTFFISIMAVIGGLQGGFDQARVMTSGGPAGSTTTLSYYVYNKAFQDLDLGYAAAISWVLFAVIFIATAINWRFGRELEVGP
jgi:multiple sugar transport system permease protein